MSAYYNVMLIRDKNISERYSIQPLAMSAKCDYSLTHLIASTLITIISALASTLNADFPVQNSFNLLDVSLLSPLSLQTSLITRVFVLNFCSVSLSSHMILGSQGHSRPISNNLQFSYLGPGICEWNLHSEYDHGFRHPDAKDMHQLLNAMATPQSPHEQGAYAY